MRRSDALYYPNVEPPIRWLRSAALFFDTVRSFVPTESENSLSQELREFEKITKAWEPYPPTESTSLLVDLPERDLDEAFSAIVAKSNRELEITIKDGQIRISDHVFMHGSKLSDRVRDRLEAHGLLLPQEFKEGDWWLVNQRASDLILSYIADSLAAKQGWTSITDDDACYIFNALGRSGLVPGQETAEDQLVRMMVVDLVPDVIERLPIETYCELRARYEPIRDRLAVFLNEVVVENRLSRIFDGRELQQAIDECVKDLKKEILNFKNSAFGRTFGKWGPFYLGSLITITTAIAHFDPALAISLAAANLLFKGVDKAGMLERKMTKRGEMIRLLAGARNDIIDSLDIKPLLIP